MLPKSAEVSVRQRNAAKKVRLRETAVTGLTMLEFLGKEGKNHKGLKLVPFFIFLGEILKGGN